MISDRAVTVVVGVVLAVWALGMAVQIVSNSTGGDFELPGAVHGVFTTVVTTVLTIRLKGGKADAGDSE